MSVLVCNTLSLHYIDKNWKRSGRGYANNVHLIIDFDNHRYRYIVNYSMPSFGANRIEVKRKSDIDDYVKYLKAYDFVETNEEILR